MLDISIYSRRLKKALKEMGACGLYVVAPKGGKPSKIGIAEDVVTRLCALRAAHWEPLDMYHLAWLQSRLDAGTLERLTHVHLQDKRVSGEWFDVTPDVARAAIEKTAAEHYACAPLKWHEDIAAAFRETDVAAYSQKRPKLTVLERAFATALGRHV